MRRPRRNSLPLALAVHGGAWNVPDGDVADHRAGIAEVLEAGWALLGGTTHIAGQSSDQRRSGLFGTYIIQPLKGDAISLDVPQFDVNHAELDAFAKACEGGPEFPIPLDQMIHGVAATDAVIRSAASGKTEKVV